MISLCVAMLALLVQARAQTNESGYSIAASGPHHRVWQRVTAGTNHLGKVTYRTNAYVELATGLNRLVGTNWVASSDAITLTGTGGAATNTQHQVFFTANINTNGAIRLVGPTGNTLRSSVLGIKFLDRSSGSNVVIAQVQDSIGQILQSSNQVLYTNALVDSHSSFFCDVLYTQKRFGFEQDVILRQQLPSPESMGLNPHETLVQIWTQFYDPPGAVVNTNTVTQMMHGHHHMRLTNETISFNSLRIGSGTAFSTGSSTNGTGTNQTAAVPVAKQWVQDGTNTYLVEEVMYDAIVSQTASLPPSASAAKPMSKDTRQASFRTKRKSSRQQARAQPLLMASAEVKPDQGFMLDYPVIAGSLTNYNFQSDTTYFISGATYLYGPSNVIEGGTVIKAGYAPGAASVWLVDGDLICHTAPYRPAVFASTNDDTVGERISGSTGNPSLILNNCTLNLPVGGANLHDLRFSYQFNSIACGGGDVELRNCQFVNCSLDVSLYGTTTNLGLHNILAEMADSVDSPANAGTQESSLVSLLGTGAVSLSGEHLTADLGSQPFVGVLNGLDDYTTDPVTVTNSILLTTQLNPIDPWGNPAGNLTGTNYTYYASANPGTIFQTVGAGNYYLATNSGCQAAGMAETDPVTLADIQRKTTQPPVVLASQYATSMTMSPQVQRDTSSSPDLGYHYDPLDYAVNDLYLVDATVTVNAGTAIACYQSSSYNLGILSGPNGNFVSVGTPDQPNRIVAYDTIQEQPDTNWALIPSYTLLIPNLVDTSAFSLKCRFTDFSVMAQDAYLLQGDSYVAGGNIGFQDCEFRNGQIDLESGVSFTNCLLARVNALIETDGTGPVYLRNNLLWNGFFEQDLSITANVIQDNVFYKTTFAYEGGGTNYTAGYNAFFQTIPPIYGGLWTGVTLQNTNATDKVLTVDPGYEVGPLGSFYLPTNNTTLFEQGNTNANLLGLYEYTTQTNEVKEAANIVTIGYHYVATDASGNAASTLWLGVPDYITDTNSDGAPALVAWQSNYFGHIGLDPNSDPFGQGTTLLQDFQSGADLTQIAFTPVVTNFYVATTSTSVGIYMSAGIPAYISVLVDDTNTAAATWSTYDTNLNVTLGSVEGWHQVWIGVKALPTNSFPTWVHERFKFDITAPVVFIDSSTNQIVSQSLIQLQGRSSEDLSAIYFNLTNGAGFQTNQQITTSDRYFDTNTWEDTTNTFQGYDVPLVLGTNQFSVHAIDRAGNEAVTNFSVILTNDAVPPAVVVSWPQDGMQISSNAFTVFGTMDDISATVTAVVVDDTGQTNSYVGEVERNGNFWFDNLPLSNMTASVTITATDIWTNQTTTNFTVYHETNHVFSMDAIDSDQLFFSPISVTGAINDATNEIWVNGVQGTNNGDGTWSAANIPIAAGGTAVFDLSIYPPGTALTANVTSPMLNPNSANSANALSVSIKPQRTFYADFTEQTNTDTGIETRDNDLGLWASYSWQGPGDHVHWADQAGGDGLWDNTYISDSYDGGTTWHYNTAVTYAPSAFPSVVAGMPVNIALPHYWYPQPLMTRYENLDTSYGYLDGYYDDFLGWVTITGTSKGFDVIHTKIQFFTGGRADVQRKTICVAQTKGHEYRPSASATRYQKPQYQPHDTYNLVVGDMGQLGTDGLVFKEFANCATVDVTPRAAGLTYYDFDWPYLTSHPLVSSTLCTARSNPDNTRTTIGVGEIVYLYLAPPDSLNANWSTTSGSLSSLYGGTVALTAPSRAGAATVTAKVRGATTSINFTVLEPSGVKASLHSYEMFSVGSVGAGIRSDVVLQPTTVSFSNVRVEEVGEDASSVTGYFTDPAHPAISHKNHGADVWHPVDCNNLIDDNAFDTADSFGWLPTSTSPLSWSPGGSYTWQIPALWKVWPDGTNNNLGGWTSQVMTLGSDGTMSVSKFGLSVTRSIH